jgi:hypothetical protein
MSRNNCPLFVHRLQMMKRIQSNALRQRFRQSDDPTARICLTLLPKNLSRNRFHDPAVSGDDFSKRPWRVLKSAIHESPPFFSIFLFAEHWDYWRANCMPRSEHFSTIRH